MPDADSANVYLVTGSDPAMIRLEAKKLVLELAGEDPDPFALDVVRKHDDGSAVETINQTVRSILSPPFLGGRKTVWLQNFEDFDAEGTADSKTPAAVAFRELARVINEEMQDDIALLISGPDVDQRKALARACKARGRIILCNRPEVRDRNWEADMRTLIGAQAADKGLALPGEVVTYLVDAIGTDTGRIDGELEKLICYCGGPDAPVSLEAAQEVCVGQGDAVSWALSNAIGERNLPEALRVLDVLLRRGKDADTVARSLLTQVANFIRQLLQIRVFMQDRRLRTAQQVKSACQALDDEERQRCGEEGLSFISFHPFRVQTLSRQALDYTGRELIQGVRLMRDANWKSVSSSVSVRVLLEEALIRLIGRAPARRDHAVPPVARRT